MHTSIWADSYKRHPAGAELAKRIVSGESLHAGKEKHARVDSFFSVQDKPKDKGVAKPERTLIIVGYVSPWYA